MNPIKFMAWDNVDKCMFHEVQNGIDFDDGSRYEFSDFFNRDDYHKWELFQFTGLQDKNGEEVYDGHVLRYKGEHTLIVKWDGKDFLGFDAVTPDHFDNKVYDCLLAVGYEKYIEIIGHKCAHPELLR